MLQQGIDWTKHHWRWLLLNMVAAGIMFYLLKMAKIKTVGYGYGASTFDVTFMESGRWAIRFLLFSLAMTPVYRIFGWKWVIPLRKPAGLWAFAFAALHFSYYIFLNRELTPEMVLQTPYMMVGFTALAMLALMALTSNRWAMKWLGKAWKRLHRLVYVVAVLVIVHVILALMNSKKSIMNPGWATEFLVYGVIAGTLLALRVPFIRSTVVSILTLGRGKVKRKRSEATLATE
jgi:methionine sulfoxide reductase heme-binding subunit